MSLVEGHSQKKSTTPLENISIETRSFNLDLHRHDSDAKNQLLAKEEDLAQS